MWWCSADCLFPALLRPHLPMSRTCHGQNPMGCLAWRLPFHFIPIPATPHSLRPIPALNYSVPNHPPHPRQPQLDSKLAGSLRPKSFDFLYSDSPLLSAACSSGTPVVRLDGDGVRWSSVGSLSAAPDEEVVSERGATAPLTHRGNSSPPVAHSLNSTVVQRHPGSGAQRGASALRRNSSDFGLVWPLGRPGSSLQLRYRPGPGLVQTHACMAARSAAARAAEHRLARSGMSGGLVVCLSVRPSASEPTPCGPCHTSPMSDVWPLGATCVLGVCMPPLLSFQFSWTSSRGRLCPRAGGAKRLRRGVPIRADLTDALCRDEHIQFAARG